MSKHIGKKYDKLTVIGIDKKFSGGRPNFLCQCDCGNTITRRADALTSPWPQSCGCHRSTKHTNKVEYRKTAQKNKYLRKMVVKYNLTLDEYIHMVNSQGNRCKICNQKEDKLDQFGDVQRLCVDHCHKTQIVRGLLCNRCNNLLGRAKDSVIILESAIRYLEESQAIGASPQ